MAWRSSGSSNQDMVSNLKRFGVIRTQAVEDAFRAVDRRFFVPQNRLNLAHSDQPLKEGNVHISAPHIYGCIVEALDLTPNSSLSFLNVGSGTGYLSTIVANILGPTGVCYGVDIHTDAIEHCMSSMERWNAANGAVDLPHMEFIHGNGLQIDATTGESLVGFDRIYVGASVEKGSLNELASLLRPGGILVGPVDDELVKVLRLSRTSAISGGQSPPRDVHGRTAVLSDDFSQQVISGVRFAPLLNNPSLPTVIRSRVWGPSVHRYYPESFKRTCKEILLCSNASKYQPPKIVEKRINVSAKLPRAIWVEILSYTHRDWFEPPRSVEEVLRQQLEEQRQALQRAQEARSDAEARLRMAERERDGYRMLALRWQSRLQALMREGTGTAREGENGDAVLDSADLPQAASAIFRRDPVFLRLGGINAMIRQFQEDSSDDEDDHEEESEDNADNMEADSEDDGSAASAMEEVSEETDADSSLAALPPTASASMQIRPARAVSISTQDI